MPTADPYDADLLDLAQNTAEVADCMDDPIISARLYQIARELQELACPARD